MRYVLACVLIWAMASAAVAEQWTTRKEEGYRGIWYYNQKTDTEYRYKYSGGLGTYCAKHIPMAVYAPEVDKTFFVFGGTTGPKERNLLEMVSFYDHKTGTVPMPTRLMDKKTSDAHDNPVLSIDDNGHLWVFASAHGTSRPAYIFRSANPFDIDSWELVSEFNYSYPQPWCLPGKGFLFLQTHYSPERGLYWMTSERGYEWTGKKKLAYIHRGHYQVSWPNGDTVGTAFNYHPKAFNGDEKRSGLNWRTNLYYVQTADSGASWTNAAGKRMEPPITQRNNPALVRDYESEGLLCYMKDLKYDPEGNPVILHVTSKSWEPGPDFGPRTWTIAHWTGDEWTFSEVAPSDNNYDTGALFIEEDVWRVIGPTQTGPQPFNPGGEMAVWASTDGGKTWDLDQLLTENSPYNHTYARAPLHAHPQFCAFWADGHGRQPSDSRLYFYDSMRRTVFRLPYEMEKPVAEPEAVHTGP